MSTTDTADDSPDGGETDPAAVAEALARWADLHRRRELERAVDRLAATDGVSDREREVVASLSRSLTASLLGPSLTAARDERAAECVAGLFDLEDR